MRNTSINIQKIIYLSLLVLGSYFYGQVRLANSIAISSAANSSAFIDASSDPSYNATTNVGKGLLFPRTNLATFTSFSEGTFGQSTNYPFFYDGFVVYNTATTGVAGVGATEGTLCRGLWYYDNPSGTINGGTWRPFEPTACSIPRSSNPIFTNLKQQANSNNFLK
ncbi:hypothetical protein D1632_03360 [Chryseobacterium nematophagum]|uniref:Uncharacterized protein n=1 Tax=Chryseobacterium nematophagum TaxID=2305228 RepID=A0A3M7LG17_9FLAO|nr:hypothetical protein [Chryseobacterium nematophagum]RMZ61020.1 hypothetical protein D1632_03360 [Chryseobacterium nematophagum]